MLKNIDRAAYQAESDYASAQRLTDWQQLVNLPPHLGSLTSAVVAFITAYRTIGRNSSLLSSLEESFVIPQLNKLPQTSKNLDLQVPRVNPKEITSDCILQMLKNFPLPIVIEGLAKDCDAVQSWTPDFFGKHYGDFEVCVDSTYGSSNQVGFSPLGDVVKDILAGETNGRYVQNISNLFLTYPELEAQLPLDKIRGYLSDKARLFGIQLFLGGPGTGTQYHCARGTNFFVNIFGEKEWIFVNPHHTPWIYPEVHSTGLHAIAMVDYRKSASQQQEKFPLYSRIPVFKAHLKPGDVLINPSWWWHAIRNLTPATIACSTRWLVPTKNLNPLYSGLTLLSPYYLTKVVKEFAFNPKARMRDEVFRNVYKKDYKRFQKAKKKY